jgi:16S rRNA (uracil1498-N3)-methyltransferase
MSAPRFAITRASVERGIARVTGAELHHMRAVARLKPGAEVTLLDDHGTLHTGRIVRFESTCALVEVLRSRDPVVSGNPTIILAAAHIKGPRMDFLVEKAAELGVAELWPLVCERSVVQAPGAERLARWRRLALAAAKQSLAAHALEIRPPRSVADTAQNVPKECLAVLCAPGAEPIAALIRRVRPRAIILASGPEGGFVQREAAAMAAAGFVAAGLGPNRLRSETAALAALSIAAGVLDEINGRTDPWL